MTGALSFNGQRCTALKILFVHEDVVEPFWTSSSASSLRSSPACRGSQAWPSRRCPSRARLTTDGLVADATAKGARVLNEGVGSAAARSSTQPCSTLSAPTCASTMKNSSAPGARGALPRPANGDRLRARLRLRPAAESVRQRPADHRHAGGHLRQPVGRINLNAQCQRGPDTYPFNGRKNSAEGTLSVHDALRVFSIRTLVATKFQQANKELISEIIRNRQSSFLTTDYIF